MSFLRAKCLICERFYPDRIITARYKRAGLCISCAEKIKTDGDMTFEPLPPLKVCVAPFLYEGELCEAVKNFKFGNQSVYGIVFGKMLADKIENHKALRHCDAVIPVPLHSARFIERGFNQSELIAQVVAERFDLPMLTDALFRVKETQRQSSLNAKERAENVKDAFLADEGSVKDRSIMLIDDIYTMGETAKACAVALLAAGAREVSAVALCKTIK